MSENTIVLDCNDATVKPLIQTIRDAVNGRGKYVAYAAAHNVTRDNVKHHAAALAVAAYPNDKPVQKIDGVRTRFGNAVQAAGYGLRATLDSAAPKVPDYMAALVKATENAHDKGNLNTDQIVAAVLSALNVDLSAVA